jgi:Domain of unknown function (DUF4158)
MVPVAARLFSDDQLDQLRSFPDIGKDDLIRYFTLTGADVAFVDPGRGRGPGDRLGFAVQLCTLPWLGFVPDEVTAAPPVAVTWRLILASCRGTGGENKPVRVICSRRSGIWGGSRRRRATRR